MLQARWLNAVAGRILSSQKWGQRSRRRRGSGLPRVSRFGVWSPFSGEGTPSSDFALSTEQLEDRALLAGTWTAVADISVARFQLQSATDGTKIYIAGGHNGSSDDTTVESYDPSTNMWTTLAPLPDVPSENDGRYGGTMGEIGGKLYLAGGWRISPPLPSNTLEIYDIATDTWSFGPTMPSLSACSQGGVIDGKLYVLTACLGFGGYFHVLYEFDPVANSWATKASPTYDHPDGAAAIIDGKLYVAGGYDDVLTYHGKLEIYDPATDTWSFGTDMPTARNSVSGAELNGKFYTLGGGTGGAPLTTVEVYDPATDTWSTDTSLPTARTGMTAVSLDGFLYAIGGSGPVDTVFKFDSVPIVTDANVSISGATGAGGTFKIGDTVTATWDNTSSGDNNLDIATVTVDFTQFGGGAAVAAMNTGDVWTATYTVVAGSIDATNRNVSVTATDDATQTTTTADTSNAKVDNVAPTVSDAAISISGATGAGGTVFKTGDTLTVSWNNNTDGNSDVASVTANVSQFGGTTITLTDPDTDGIFTGTYMIVAGAIEATNRNVSVTVTDDADNSTTTADTSNASVDNVAPVVSSVTASPTTVADATTTFTVTVVFDEAMNTSVSPTLVFAPDVTSGSATLSFSSEMWSGGNTTYTATYTVSDQNVDVNSVTIDVTGAQDAAGNAQENYSPLHEFDIDTLNPTADIVDVTPDPLTGSNAGVVTINFSEGVTGVGIADFSLTLTTIASGTTTVDLSGLTVTMLSASQYTIDLSTVTTDEGSYELTLNAATSGIEDLAGNDLLVDAADDWVLPTSVVDVSGGSVTVTDTGTPTDNQMTVSFGTGDAGGPFAGQDVIIIHDPNGIAVGAGGNQIDNFTIEIPVSSLTGGLTIDGGEGNDTLILDFSSGNPVPPGGLNFDGGDGGDDALVVIGDGINDSVNYTPSTSTSGAGTLAYNDGSTTSTIMFTGLEPVDITAVPSVTVSGSAGVDDLALTEGVDFTMGGANQAIRVTGTVNGGTIMESAAVWNVTTLVIETLGGNDTVTIASAANAHGITDIDIELGANNDELVVAGDFAVAGTVSVDGGSGNDTLTGLDAASTWTVDATSTYVSGANTLEFDGLETLSGGSDVDDFVLNTDSTLALQGNAGDDSFAFADGVSAGSVSGGADTDTLDYSAYTTGVTVNLAAGTASNLTSFVTGIESILGGSGDDSLTGSVGDDTLNGGAGNDTLSGGLGNDSLIGGADTDRVVESVSGTSTLTDALLTGKTGGGTDDLDSIEEASLTGGNGNDTISAAAFGGNATLNGGNGADLLTGSSQADSLNGGAGNDTLLAGDGDDSLTGGAGNDSLNGEGGQDTLTELITGKAVLTNIKLTGQGTDKLASIERIDLTGNSGNNLIDASRYTLGDVTLRGGDGNDTLLGGAGNDLLEGGVGTDTVKQMSYSDQTLTDGLLTGNGDDVLDSIERADLTAKSSAGNTIDAEAFSGIVSLTGGDWDDLLIASQRGGTLRGGSGEDTLVGSDDPDSLDGGEGDDSITGGGSDDRLRGGRENDFLDGGSGSDWIFGEHGEDLIFGGTGNDTIDGGTHNDIISGDAGDDRIAGGIGHDAISGGDGADFLDGQAGNDTLLGDNGHDTLRGGVGSDVCLGGTGNDNVDGGAGRDTVAGNEGTDVISSLSEIDDAFLFDFDSLLV